MSAADVRVCFFHVVLVAIIRVPIDAELINQVLFLYISTKHPAVSVHLLLTDLGFASGKSHPVFCPSILPFICAVSKS